MISEEELVTESDPIMRGVREEEEEVMSEAEPAATVVLLIEEEPAE